jgi:hypothetical protein
MKKFLVSVAFVAMTAGSALAQTVNFGALTSNNSQTNTATLTNASQAVTGALSVNGNSGGTNVGVSTAYTKNLQNVTNFNKLWVSQYQSAF